MQILTEYRLSPRRTLRAGDMCELKYLRGQYKFISVYITTSGSISLNFIGGPAGHTAYKSVRPDRVKTIKRERIV